MKAMVGKVVGLKMQDTAIVEVVRFYTHAIYKKKVRRTKRYHVHTQRLEVKRGQGVAFVQTRPLSKTKRWRITKTLNREEKK